MASIINKLLCSWDLVIGDELCEARDHRDYILTCVARWANDHGNLYPSKNTYTYDNGIDDLSF